jgi:hypothetical protein
MSNPQPANGGTTTIWSNSAREVVIETKCPRIAEKLRTLKAGKLYGCGVNHYRRNYLFYGRSKAWALALIKKWEQDLSLIEKSTEKHGSQNARECVL